MEINHPQLLDISSIVGNIILNCWTYRPQLLDISSIARYILNFWTYHPQLLDISSPIAGHIIYNWWTCLCEKFTCFKNMAAGCWVDWCNQTHALTHMILNNLPKSEYIHLWYWTIYQGEARYLVEYLINWTMTQISNNIFFICCPG